MTHAPIFLPLLPLCLLAACSAGPAQNATSAAQLAPPQKFQRDWTTAPAIVQIDTGQDVYAVGDPHADYPRLAAVLTGAKIIAGPTLKPEGAQWTAGKAVVVFTGDMIDKGPAALPVIALIRSLQKQAAQTGGRVVVSMGNHEAEFLAAPTEKKVEDFATELTNAHLSPTDVAACQGDLGLFLCNLPFAVRVNDWFFSHGGNTAGRSMQTLITDLQAGVDQSGFATGRLVGPDSILEARLGKTPWFEPNQADPQATLAAYAKVLGVAHIVQGHQPGSVLFSDQTERAKGELFQRYGLIFLEDTGMSSGIDDSHGAVLHIVPGKHEASAICFNGVETKIWNDKELANLGRIAPCMPQ